MDYALNEHNLLEYIMAGNATITVLSDSTGARYTYHIAAAPYDKSFKHKCWFVKLLVGADNESDYVYIGCLRDDYRFYNTPASKLSAESKPVVAFRYVTTCAQRHKIHSKLHVYRPNKCGRCGRTLTTPESIVSGFGPECRELI